MTGQDIVAVILALTVAAVLLAVTVAVVFAGYKVTGEGVLGAIVGALIVAVIRYIQRTPA
jgi:uncharacterized membrane protein